MLGRSVEQEFANERGVWCANHVLWRLALMTDRRPSTLSSVLCGLIVLVALLAAYRWQTRPQAEAATLERYLRTLAADQASAGPGHSAIIGDSLTVAAPLLPVCGRVVVKAAFNGAQAQQAVDYIMPPLSTSPPAAVLIAIGVNDAWRHIATPRAQRLADFDVAYRGVIDAALALTPTVGIVLLPSVAKDGDLGVSFFDPPLIDQFNQIIVKLAKNKQLPVFSLAALSGPDGFSRSGLTHDGIHLTPAGYAVWMQVVTLAWRTIQPCPER
jgi:lysophospholipase L1-like esterase